MFGLGFLFVEKIYVLDISDAIFGLQVLWLLFFGILVLRFLFLGLQVLRFLFLDLQVLRVL